MWNVTRAQAGNYSCQGYNGAANASRVSPARPLLVQYAPGDAKLSALDSDQSYAIKGQTLTLECRCNDHGNPAAHTFIWTHNGRRVESVSVAENHLLRVGPADVHTRGDYACAAINTVGQGRWANLWLDVKTPPRLVHGLEPTLGSLANRSLTMSCRVECHPTCAVQWFRNNDSLPPITDPLTDYYYHVESVEHQLDERNGAFGSLTSYLHVHNSSALNDHDVITCACDGNGVGPGVRSSLVYRHE
ncbi:unnamed protein product, partial [Medioppia subpectinata]